jgi:hypothetical protein
MSKQIMEKIKQTPKAEIVSSLSNVPLNGGVKAQERANEILGKNKKSKPKKKKEPQSFTTKFQNRLANLGKREKALTAIIEIRTKTIAKMQGNLEIFKTMLQKTKDQKATELLSIEELKKALESTKT